MLNEKIFREYDIRGVVDKDIDRNIAISVGKTFATYLKSKLNPELGSGQNSKLKVKVSVGRDVRLSSDDLASAIIEGIASTGIDVYDLGVCPTPLQYFSIFHLDLDGGIMVTGSHNPPEYNGFKISIGKETIHGKDIQRMKEIMTDQVKAKAEVKEKVEVEVKEKVKVKNYDIVDAYKSYMLKEFSYLNGSEYKRLKVVIDAGNGTAGIVAPEILSGIGCDVIPLYCEPDGNFPNHHPDPTVVDNIQDLITWTKRSGADIGIGYDGDADRIGIVDNSGNIIWGDQLMIVISREILKHKPNAKVIGDVKCSQTMFDDIAKNGGIPIMWKTGHSLIKQKMREEGALIAGEFSGHIFIGDRYFGYDDAIYATLRLIEIMKNTGEDIKGLLSNIPEMFYTPEIRLDCPEDKKKEIVESIVTRFMDYRENGGSPYRIKDLNTIDGVRVVFDKGWGLIRSSNTQPVIVMRVEAEDEESLNDYRAFLEREFNKAMKL
jgi:phosphomannomutase/phosphoglucomutase